METAIDLKKAEGLAPCLGQDFMTWLWFRSETQGGMFKIPTGGAFELFLEQRITVQGGEGERKETAVCRGPHAELKEAKHGLSTGKKVHQAQLRLEQDGMVWQLQLKAEDFTCSGLKTPKVEFKPEEGEDPDGAFLEKIFLIEKALDLMDRLYASFLDLRLGPGWAEERRRIKHWIDQ